MSKKRKKVKEAVSSPANFFKTRARSLPLHKCFVSDNWEETRLPTVVVSRRHKTGNVSACLYMVDLNCLGVISTHHIFNVPEEDMIQSIDYFFENALEKTKYMETSYIISHNIIYTAVEFAREWSIPVKSHFFITREFLEPDDENIELIEIECGDQGIPVFSRQMYEDFFPGKADAIIKKLDKYPGPGNYKLITQFSSEVDGDEWDNDDWDVDDLDEDGFDDLDEDELYDPENNPQTEDDSENNYTPEDFEKDKKHFLKNFSKISSFNGVKFKNFEIVLDRLTDYLADNELIEKYYSTLFHLEFDEIALVSLPDGFINLNEASPGFEQKVVEVMVDYMADDKRARQNIKKLEKLIGYQSLIVYLSLAQDKLENIDPAAIDRELHKAMMEFPDCPLLRLFHYSQISEKSEGGLQLPDEILSVSNYFAGRTSIHLIELQAYAGFIINYLESGSDLEKLIAFEDYLMDLILPDEIYHAFSSLITSSKIIFVKERLKGFNAN